MNEIMDQIAESRPVRWVFAKPWRAYTIMGIAFTAAMALIVFAPGSSPHRMTP